MKLQKAVFDETHPLWDIFIHFHSGMYDSDPKLRRKAKALLFAVHYGNVDTGKAEAVIARAKSFNQTQNK